MRKDRRKAEDVSVLQNAERDVDPLAVSTLQKAFPFDRI